MYIYMRAYIIYHIFMLFTHLNIVDQIYTLYIHSIYCYNDEYSLGRLFLAMGPRNSGKLSISFINESYSQFPYVVRLSLWEHQLPNNDTETFY